MDKIDLHIKLDFRKFSSIENCVERHILDLQKHGFINDLDEWVAMEKIHGANFSFLTDGETVCTAKRGGFLTLDDKFYNHKSIAKKYASDICLIYQKIKSDIPDVTTIQVFGEIFGGYYPGFKPTNYLVQKEVLYKNEVDFLVFDIKINKGSANFWFLSQDEVDTYLANLSVLQGVPVLARGKFDKMISLNPEFPTTIPMMYCLSPVDNNMAEGFVIKLNQRHTGNIIRPIVKHKNKKFFESKSKVVSNNKFVPNNKFADKLIEYCTKNRFNNTISKIGPDNKIEKIRGIFIADAVLDMKKDLDPTELEEFEKCIKKVKEGVSVYLMINRITNNWLEEYLSPIAEIN